MKATEDAAAAELAAQLDAAMEELDEAMAMAEPQTQVSAIPEESALKVTPSGDNGAKAASTLGETTSADVQVGACAAADGVEVATKVEAEGPAAARAMEVGVGAAASQESQASAEVESGQVAALCVQRPSEVVITMPDDDDILLGPAQNTGGDVDMKGGEGKIPREVEVGAEAAVAAGEDGEKPMGQEASSPETAPVKRKAASEFEMLMSDTPPASQKNIASPQHDLLRCSSSQNAANLVSSAGSPSGATQDFKSSLSPSAADGPDAAAHPAPRGLPSTYSPQTRAPLASQPSTPLAPDYVADIVHVDDSQDQGMPPATEEGLGFEQRMISIGLPGFANMQASADQAAAAHAALKVAAAEEAKEMATAGPQAADQARNMDMDGIMTEILAASGVPSPQREAAPESPEHKRRRLQACLIDASKASDTIDAMTDEEQVHDDEQLTEARLSG